MHDNADGAGDLQVLTHHVERPRQRVEDAVDDLHAVFLRLHALEQQQKLVAADAGHGVTGSRLLDEALGGEFQDLVARRMAKRVVDRLEAVEVNEEHGQLFRRARLVYLLQTLHCMSQAVFEQQPIRQARQRVGERVLQQLVVGALQAGVRFSQ